MIFVRFWCGYFCCTYWRAIFSAVSTASEPLLTKTTWLRVPGSTPARRCASSSDGRAGRESGVYGNWRICRAAASTSRSCPKPTLTHQRPAIASMYSLPDASTTVLPCPATITSGGCRSACCVNGRHSSSRSVGVVSTCVDIRTSSRCRVTAQTERFVR
jgi:hypothetical protein